MGSRPVWKTSIVYAQATPHVCSARDRHATGLAENQGMGSDNFQRVLVVPGAATTTVINLT